MNPYHPQRASTPQTTQESSARVTHAGRVLCSRIVSPDADDGTVPVIMLRGRWLARIGFRARARIRVEVSLGQIVITLVGVSAPTCEPMPMNFRNYHCDRARRVSKRVITPPWCRDAGLSRY